MTKQPPLFSLLFALKDSHTIKMFQSFHSIPLSAYSLGLFTTLVQEMKKIVLKLELNDVKDKQKAMKAVSILQGIDSIRIDMNVKIMTVIGSVDPVSVVTKLRKFWSTNIVSIGPAKEEKKEEPKKEEAKKEETKKEVPKEEPLESQMAPEFVDYPPVNYNPYTTTYYYYVPSAQDNPNSCNGM